PVDEQVDVGEEVLDRLLERGGGLADRREEALRRLARRRRRLGLAQPPAVVVEDETVGERPADINTDLLHPSRLRVSRSRTRGFPCCSLHNRYSIRTCCNHVREARLRAAVFPG